MNIKYQLIFQLEFLCDFYILLLCAAPSIFFQKYILSFLFIFFSGQFFFSLISLAFLYYQQEENEYWRSDTDKALCEFTIFASINLYQSWRSVNIFFRLVLIVCLLETLHCTNKLNKRPIFGDQSQFSALCLYVPYKVKCVHIHWQLHEIINNDQMMQRQKLDMKISQWHEMKLVIWKLNCWWCVFFFLLSGVGIGIIWEKKWSKIYNVSIDYWADSHNAIISYNEHMSMRDVWVLVAAFPPKLWNRLLLICCIVLCKCILSENIDLKFDQFQTFDYEIYKVLEVIAK